VDVADGVSLLSRRAVAQKGLQLMWKRRRGVTSGPQHGRAAPEKTRPRLSCCRHQRLHRSRSLPFVLASGRLSVTRANFFEQSRRPYQESFAIISLHHSVQSMRNSNWYAKIRCHVLRDDIELKRNGICTPSQHPTSVKRATPTQRGLHYVPGRHLRRVMGGAMSQTLRWHVPG
jgi:hypothetical protein